MGTEGHSDGRRVSWLGKNGSAGERGLRKQWGLTERGEESSRKNGA